jgi:hypothetical protein
VRIRDMRRSEEREEREEMGSHLLILPMTED